MGALEIDAKTTALVAIDLQKGIVAMPAEPHEAAAVVANAARLAGAFRRRGAPVFLVHVVRTAGLALQPPADSPMPARADLPADWSEIVPAMGPEPGDVVVAKRQWGAFYGTDLELRLRRGGIRTLVLAGIATSYGVESTARFAYEYGFEQVFAEDAITDRSAEAHRVSVEYVLKRVGRVRTTAEILAALA